MTETAIPDDIDRIATAIVRDPFGEDEDSDYSLYLRIAKALQDERERCARLVQELPLCTLTKAGDRDPYMAFNVGADAQRGASVKAIRRGK